MKYLFCLLIFFATACTSNVTKQENQDVTAKPRNVGMQNDTIFLGYYFGMDQNKFNSRTQKLLREGKILKGNHGNEYFMLYTTEDSFEAYIGKPDFENNKLYQCNLNLTPSGKGSFTWTDLENHLVSLLSRKFMGGPEDMMDENSHQSHFWSNSNRVVSLGIYPNVGFACINYVQTEVKAQVEKAKMEKNQLDGIKNTDKSKRDL